MKKTSIFILLLSVFVASSSFAADFVEVTSDDNYAIYVDVASIEKRDDYVVAWVKWIYRGEQLKEMGEAYKTPVEYTMEFSAYSLKGKQSQALETITYGPNGKLVNRYSSRFSLSQYTEVIPASYGENIYGFVMYNYCYNETNSVVKNAKIQSGTKIVSIADEKFRFPDTMPDYVICNAIMKKFYPAEQYFSSKFSWTFYSSRKLEDEEAKSGVYTPTTGAWKYHVIGAGETLSEIAMQYGGITAQDILKANALKDASQLTRGDIICIPNTAEHVYDTLNMVMALKARAALLAQAYQIVQEPITQNAGLYKFLWPVIISVLIGLLLLYIILRKRKTVGKYTSTQKEEFFNKEIAEEISMPKDTQEKTLSGFQEAFAAIGTVAGFYCFVIFLEKVFNLDISISFSLGSGIVFFGLVFLILQCFPKKMKLKARNKVFIFIVIGTIWASFMGAADVGRLFLTNGSQEKVAENVMKAAENAALFYTALIYLGMSSIAVVLRFFVLRVFVMKKPIINFIISLACSGVMVALSVELLGTFLAGELFYTWVYVLNVNDGASLGKNN